MPQHENAEDDLDEETAVSGLTVSTLMPKGKEKKPKKAATFGLDATATQAAPVLVNEGLTLQNVVSSLVHASPDVGPE